ncbi:MAG: DUF2807 domain-containing protein [Deltaproteobacteria bacterium]|nr:DUF2807 domain-containing protein [Deltaproteobacteria bacterium]
MNTTRSMTLATFAIAGLLAVGAEAKGRWEMVRGSGKVVKETREVAKFDRVSASSGINLELSVGAAKVVLEGEDNILPLVVTRVRGGELEIRYEENTNINDSGVTVHVTVPSLSEVSVSGGSRADGEVAKSEELELDSSGGGEIHLTGVDTKDLTVEVSGGGRADVQGKAEMLTAEVSGGARLKGTKLTVQKARVNGSGGCTVQLNVTQSVRGDLSGGCDMAIKGDARIRVAASGGSSVSANGEDVTPRDD